ncbi:MAG: hypothetical protein LBP81_09595 [Treponema sp.]|jgi:hypothetical protein|nr:hypothetical protein [Treponema sp.]
MNASAWKKVTFFFCCLCCIPAILSSAGFVFSHIDHNCTGSGCPACAQIQEAVKFLGFLGVSLTVILTGGVRKQAAPYTSPFITATLPPLTGITLKVRFNT